ncbi:MAG: hypothetical protein KBT12_06665 [Bacteroidales bacterium]|nr:hypothetical protein [Candidatus Physcousia equi]
MLDLFASPALHLSFFDLLVLRINLSNDQSEWIRIFELGGRTDTALDTLRRRSMLMGFRSALVACATEKVQKDTVSIANLAVWVAQEVLDQQMALFSKGLNAVNRHEASVKEGVQQQLRSNSTLKILAKLPSPFSKEDLVQTRKEMGLTGPVDTSLHRWRKRGLIEEVAVDNKKMYQIINIKDT